jgi:hypothetical protein
MEMSKNSSGTAPAKVPDNYGQSWSQAKPANGTPWGENSSDQYDSSVLNAKVVNRGGGEQ